MIKEALDFLAAKFRAADTPVNLSELLNLDDNRRRVVCIGGKVEEVNNPPASRAHQFDDLDDLLAFANRFPGCSIWHDVDRVVCLVDDDDRFEHATLQLEFGSQYAALVDHANAPLGLNQLSFVRFLKFHLGLPEPFIVAFRRLNWRTEETGTTAHGASSMGKSIEAASNGADQLPESAVLEIPVYSNPGADSLQTIRLLVDVDTVEQKLRLIPEPDALQQAVDRVQTQIHVTLRGGLPNETPLYRGRP